MSTWKQRLKQLEAIKIASFPLIVHPEGKRFRIDAPSPLAGRSVSQAWIDASGAAPVIIDNVLESESTADRCASMRNVKKPPPKAQGKGAD